MDPEAEKGGNNNPSGPFSPPSVSLLVSHFLDLANISFSINLGVAVFLEQSYLLAAEERERGQGLDLCTLTAEILEYQTIVVSLKVKFPNKKTSEVQGKRQEEIFFQSLQIFVFIFNHY